RVVGLALRDLTGGSAVVAPPSRHRPSLAQTGVVISRELAADLRDAGLAWTPTKGDWFVIPDKGLDALEFVVSDMVIETRRMAFDRQLLAFNGTTEWAMDTLAVWEALWLPGRGHVREGLRGA